MEIKIQRHYGNNGSLAGFLIESAFPIVWIKAIQNLGLVPERVGVYPLPGQVANSVWGCLVVVPSGKLPPLLQFEGVQLRSELLYIPEHTALVPDISDPELKFLLREQPHLFHPSIGWVPLPDPLKWEALLEPPAPQPISVFAPESIMPFPQRVASFSIQAPPPEETLISLENDVVPEQKSLKTKPLNKLEKAKLGFYKLFFSSKNIQKKNKSGIRKTKYEKPVWLQKVAGTLGEKAFQVMDRMMLDLEELEKRNQKEMNKLLDLLRRNPEEALKYAIPLDPNGANRGNEIGLSQWQLSRQWDSFSLFGLIGGSSGASVVMEDNAIEKLKSQYEATAKKLIKDGEYKKAAYVYLKLLKWPPKAAEVLKEAEYYLDAASVYLKYLNNKHEAAICYERGRYFDKAIELYSGLGRQEKVGDLYLELGEVQKAMLNYEKVVHTYQEEKRFLEAANLYREKMQKPERSQEMLMKGWTENQEATTCLKHYFRNILDDTDHWAALQKVRSNSVRFANRGSFLKVLEVEFKRGTSHRQEIRNMAYEEIAKSLPKKPELAGIIHHFNPGDTQIQKDAMRFMMDNKNKTF